MTDNEMAGTPVDGRSPRAVLVGDLVDWLSLWCTAPYGVIEALVPANGRKGFGRAITFGLAGTLDATVTVWSVKRLELKSSRGQDERFDSAQAFKDYCQEHYGAPTTV